MGEDAEDRDSQETFLLESAIGEAYAANLGIGSVDAAEARLLRVLELEPTREERVEALNLLAQLCAQTERHQEALERFAAALEAIEPGMAGALTLGVAEMFEKQRKWEQAIEVYIRGLALCEDASLHHGLGYCLARSGRLRDGERHHRRALDLAPDVAAYANDLGYVLLEQGQIQQARALFEHALALDPAYDLARGNLGMCSDEASDLRDD